MSTKTKHDDKFGKLKPYTRSQMSEMHRQALNEKRLKSVAIDYDMLMALFNWNGGKGRIRLPLVTGELEGAYCVDVYHRPESRSFVAVFVHKRFDPVDEGKDVPVLAPVVTEWRWMDAAALRIFLEMLPQDAHEDSPTGTELIER